MFIDLFSCGDNGAKVFKLMQSLLASLPEENGAPAFFVWKRTCFTAQGMQCHFVKTSLTFFMHIVSTGTLLRLLIPVWLQETGESSVMRVLIAFALQCHVSWLPATFTMSEH